MVALVGLVLLQNSESGMYSVGPNGDGGAGAFITECDMETDGGGWTLIGVIFGSGVDRWNDHTV